MSTMSKVVRLDPGRMPRVSTVDERYQSYNVEMLEVTGGSFWKPYASRAATPAERAVDTPAGMDPAAYEHRPPKDLGDRRLRMLAAALAPAYVRVSGTWANSVYLPDAGDRVPDAPPAGFTVVLTREQWAGVVDFSRAVGAPLVTSFAISAGTRDARGVWTADQAERVLDVTREHGGDIAAAELMNEPTIAAMSGAPAGYDGEAYDRDFAVFRDFVRRRAPGMLVLGPGSVADNLLPERALDAGAAGLIPTRRLLAGAGADVDAFSYHHYGAASARCAGIGMPTTSPADALGEEWLSRTSETLAYYRRIRDELVPGKRLWVTETAQAACGGDRWAATFIDSFRYLDQLGRLAKDDVDVVMHNTLAASDYGLLDERTNEPRPNYWAALVWSRLMGTTVLDGGVPVGPGLHLYAHSLRGRPGGVALLAINTSRDDAVDLDVPIAGERFELSADELESASIRLNGAELRLDRDEVPVLTGARTDPGTTTIAPSTIVFLALPDARNPSA